MDIYYLFNQVISLSFETWVPDLCTVQKSSYSIRSSIWMLTLSLKRWRDSTCIVLLPLIRPFTPTHTDGSRVAMQGQLAKEAQHFLHHNSPVQLCPVSIFILFKWPGLRLWLSSLAPVTFGDDVNSAPVSLQVYFYFIFYPRCRTRVKWDHFIGIKQKLPFLSKTKLKHNNFLEVRII